MPQALPRFDLEFPETVSEAVALRDQCYSSMYLAGGTDLIPRWRSNRRPPDLVINVKRIRDWDTYSRHGMWISAPTTVAALRRGLPAHAGYGALGSAVQDFNAPLVESLATVSGNLAAARSDSTFLGPLIALDASVSYVAITGEGSVRADDLVDKPGHTTIPAGAIITGILIPRPRPGEIGLSLSLRSGTVTSSPVVSASAVVEVAGDGSFRSGRLAISNAAPTPREVLEARSLFASGRHWKDVLTEIGDAAVDAAYPDDDLWASARYRQRMARVATDRLIRQLMEENSQ